MLNTQFMCTKIRFTIQTLTPTCWPGHPATSLSISFPFPNHPYSHLSFSLQEILFWWSCSEKSQNCADYSFHYSVPKMAIELLGYPNLNEQVAVQEAASAGLKSMEQLIRAVSHQNQQLHCKETTGFTADFTVSKFTKTIPTVSRTGHARFRRTQVKPQPESTPESPSLTPVQCFKPQNPDYGFHQPQTLSLFSDSPASAADRAPVAAPPLTLGLSFGKDKSEVICKEELSLTATLSTSANSSSTFVSTITGEGSVSNGKSGSPSMFLAPAISAGKPPLSGKRCREHDHSDNISGKTSGSSRCHCKKRYAYF